MTKLQQLKQQLQARQKTIRAKISLYESEKQELINKMKSYKCFSDYEIQESDKIKDLTFNIDNLTSKSNELSHTLIMIDLL